MSQLLSGICIVDVQIYKFWTRKTSLLINRISYASAIDGVQEIHRYLLSNLI